MTAGPNLGDFIVYPLENLFLRPPVGQMSCSGAWQWGPPVQTCELGSLRTGRHALHTELIRLSKVRWLAISIPDNSRRRALPVPPLPRCAGRRRGGARAAAASDSVPADRRAAGRAHN